ncbi:hypothetical protein M2444_004769 [Paenibacillus sp. PastF-3]|uniref:hypothetical protein n=1 Tax=Paenibacillus sp. PastF-3 TaxID=2940626 RepID=UPI002473407D|nr:hypothetical protein [Paenibacillus sp. PastF-3]MDH6372940.1 hypothetical protein [Paenibacillus sp. PastF-3]
MKKNLSFIVGERVHNAAQVLSSIYNFDLQIFRDETLGKEFTEFDESYLTFVVGMIDLALETKMNEQDKNNFILSHASEFFRSEGKTPMSWLRECKDLISRELTPLSSSFVG